jgi:hypothetical protein
VSLFREEGRSFYSREREHEARGSGARARPVSATEGTRRSGLSAEGCCALWRAAGALAGCGVVWCRGGKEWLWGGVRVVSLRFFQVSRPWVGAEGDGEGWLGTAESKNSRKGAGIHYCK